ncbi:MAG: alternative ribosome rescue aminoacyl-tRNA hydrolase ArfB [Phycisphaerales bacterium]|jgi:ribosome-associated protein
MTSTEPPQPAHDDDGPVGEVVVLAPGATVPGSALRFRQSPSSGPGGQNVNRRHTRAELRVGLLDIRMPVRARKRLRELAGERMTADGTLILTSEKTRSARRNQEDCLERLKDLCREAMIEPKRRIPTRPSRRSNERRLEAKRQNAERKRRRGGPDREG